MIVGADLLSLLNGVEELTLGLAKLGLATRLGRADGLGVLLLLLLDADVLVDAFDLGADAALAALAATAALAVGPLADVDY